MTVKTATIKGGRAVESERLPSGNINLIDYVVNQSNDRVGNPKMLRGRRPAREKALIYGAIVEPDNSIISLSALVDIVADGGSARTIKLSETLTSR